jgi:hypothetical protein
MLGLIQQSLVYGRIIREVIKVMVHSNSRNSPQKNGGNLPANVCFLGCFQDEQFWAVLPPSVLHLVLPPQSLQFS